jgi:hypothetical protein
MSEQEIWNEQIANMKLKLAPKSELKKLLNKPKEPESKKLKSKKSESSGSQSYDPIANAMERFPGLTREKAEEMAQAFGF